MVIIASLGDLFLNVSTDILLIDTGRSELFLIVILLQVELAFEFTDLIAGHFKLILSFFQHGTSSGQTLSILIGFSACFLGLPVHFLR